MQTNIARPATKWLDSASETYVDVLSICQYVVFFSLNKEKECGVIMLWKRHFVVKIISLSVSSLFFFCLYSRQYPDDSFDIAPYTYVWYTTQGNPFHVDKSVLLSIGFPLTEFVRLDEAILENFFFVMAANQRFASRSMEALAMLQRHFPKKKTIFFDLGLSTESVILVS